MIGRYDQLEKKLSPVCELAKKSLSQLGIDFQLNNTDLRLYNAGLKSGTKRFGLFARDLFISSFMLDDLNLLKDTLKFALLTQGQKQDPITGEEPGRVIHEHDEVKLRGLKTQYNAADTTQLMLIGLGKYYRDTEDCEFIKKWKKSIESAINYMLSHLEEDLFWEDPHFCGSQRYALRSTYWKDDKLPERENPEYPVAYTLVQVLTVAALREAAKLSKAQILRTDYTKLEEAADGICNSIFTKLWDDSLNFPLIAKDKKGGISGISSDALHMLAYLKPDDLPEEKLEAILERSTSLETPYGYRTYAPDQLDYSPHAYHLGSIWPYEQYFIGQSGLIHGSKDVFEKSVQIIEALDRYGFWELFGWDGEKLQALGCDLQLWTICYPLSVHKLLEES